MQYALLFPGQGSQSVGMLSALAASDPRVAATFKEASSALDWDIARLIQEGPEQQLNQTQHTQPALLAAGVAVWRVWRAEQSPVPSFLAGHSLGEYTALGAAGAIDFADALRIVRLRGQLMQAAVPVGAGAMAAVVGMDDAAVEKMCSAFPGPGVLEPANYNAPGQVVVAGSANAIEWLHANARTFGGRKIVPLAMSVPSHCSLLRGAADQLAERLAQIEIRTPSIPVLHNLDAAPRTEPDAIRTALVEQLYKPVRWSRIVQAIDAAGVKALFECGPGKVLTNLNKRIVADANSCALEKPEGHIEAAALLASEIAPQAVASV